MPEKSPALVRETLVRETLVRETLLRETLLRETLLRETLGQLLILVGRSWRRKSSDALASLGLSAATAEPLIWLSRAGGDMRQGALAQLIGIEGPSLVRLIDQLQAEGLVSRCEDPKDRRAKAVHLTPKGSELVIRIDSLLQTMRAQALQNLAEGDIEAAIRILRTIERELARDDDSKRRAAE